MKIFRASPKAAAVRNELWGSCVRFLGLIYICKMGLIPVLYLRVGLKLGLGFNLNSKVAGSRESGLYLKLGYRLGLGFKIASSLEVLLFPHRISKAFNWLADGSNRSQQVTAVGNEDSSKELVDPQLSRISLHSWKEIGFSGYGKGILDNF